MTVDHHAIYDVMFNHEFVTTRIALLPLGARVAIAAPPSTILLAIQESCHYQVRMVIRMSHSLLLVIGCVLIMHAAYSLQHYRSLVKELLESSTGVSLDVEEDTAVSSSVVYRIPPLDIWIELGIAFLMILTFELTRSGSSFPRAIVQKGEIARSKNPSVMAAPFMSRDYDIYTTRKCKL